MLQVFLRFLLLQDFRFFGDSDFRFLGALPL